MMSFRLLARSALLLACALSVPAPAWAQGVTIYRCTDAAGQLTVQNKPCPAGSTQQVQEIQGVPSAPMPAPRAAAPFPSAPPPPAFEPDAVPAADAAPRILDSAALHAPPPPAAPDAQHLPPPPLFTCHTHDEDSYLAEDQEQPPRCVTLPTVGLDGRAASSAGQACEVVRDRCVRVPDGAACEAWRRYARQAESRWRFAHPDNVRLRHDEYQRLARIVAETGCGG